MPRLTIHPSSISGSIVIPPSKSHTHRALLFSMLAKKKSTIRGPLLSPDTLAMQEAISLFGSSIIKRGDTLEIQGGFSAAENVIDAKNSGLVFRLIAGVSALLPSYTVITGDASIRKNRPIQPLLDGLEQLGAFARSSQMNGQAPIIIRGPIKPGKCRISGKDSQIVSALLIATSLLHGPSEIFVDDPGELPWIDLTLEWLRFLGAKVEHKDYNHYQVAGDLHIEQLDYTVPGDFSTASFPIVAALVTGSSLQIEGLDPHDVQGDKQIISLVQQMGANIHWKNQTLCIEPSSTLQGIEIDMQSCIDALPILAVLGCFAEGKTHLYNAQIARNKESDRIRSISLELKKMGAQIEETEDGLIIEKSSLRGAHLQAHEDHRIAMALSVAALGAQSSSTLEGVNAIKKTYPSFIQEFQKLGAQFELDLMRV